MAEGINGVNPIFIKSIELVIDLNQVPLKDLNGNLPHDFCHDVLLEVQAL